MFNYLNRGVSTPIAITIVIVLFLLVGGTILGYQYWWLPKQETEVPNIELPDNGLKSVKGDEYSFKSFEEGDLTNQQYFNYYVGIYKNGELLKKIRIENTREEPSLFGLSPNKKYVVFKTAIFGGTCVYVASPMVIDLNDFSIVNLDSSDINKEIKNALGIDPDKVIKFTAIQKIKDLKWVSDNKIEVSMQFGDDSGCPITYFGKPAHFVDYIETKVVFTF